MKGKATNEAKHLHNCRLPTADFRLQTFR